jgi:uncharacterized BrkB/YihY/UPF0761 family membrane protein
MPFASRLIFFLIAIGIAWYFSNEKNRILKALAEAYEYKDERRIGEYNEKLKFFNNGLGIMFFVLFIMFIWVLDGDFI